MNVHPLAPALPERARRLLASLPEFEASPRLRERVRQSWQAPRRWPYALAAALAATLAVIALWPTLPRPGNVDPGATALAQWQARSRALETEWLRARTVADLSSARLAGEAELARLDAALQDAYDRGAGSDELTTLWQARAGALEALVAAYRAPGAVVRI